MSLTIDSIPLDEIVFTFQTWIQRSKNPKRNTILSANGKTVETYIDQVVPIRGPFHNEKHCWKTNNGITKDGSARLYLLSENKIKYKVKPYIHHVAAYYHAYTNENPRFNIQDLKLVLKDKSSLSNAASTLSHLCGNGWCGFYDHLCIEAKSINDERTHCHFVLKNCTTLEQFQTVQSICPHFPKCFTNHY